MVRTPVSIQQFKAMVQQARASNDGDAAVVGVRLPDIYKWPFGDLRGVTFRDVDFGRLMLGSLFSRPSLTSCRFEGCVIDGISAERTRFEQRTFDGTTFGVRLFGSIWKSTFDDCAFSSCFFKGTMFFKECRVTCCRFAHCDFQRVRFVNCKFDSVQMDGTLSDVTFVGCSMSRLDLSAAKLVDTSVRDRPDQDVILPDRPANFVAFRQDFFAIRDEMRSSLSAQGFKVFSSVLKYVQHWSYGEMVDETLFADMNRIDRAIVMRRLFEGRSKADDPGRVSGMT